MLLRGEIDFRTIGWAFADGLATRPSLARIYDALIYFDQTTPSALLPF